MTEYYAACRACTMRIIRPIALALELPADFFSKDFTHPIMTLRLLHYNDSISVPGEVFPLGIRLRMLPRPSRIAAS